MIDEANSEVVQRVDRLVEEVRNVTRFHLLVCLEAVRRRIVELQRGLNFGNHLTHEVVPNMTLTEDSRRFGFDAIAQAMCADRISEELLDAVNDLVAYDRDREAHLVTMTIDELVCHCEA